ncbi:MAG TPA: hypothetical protein VI520_01970, partial [Anaerolineales bacterium]|nr:hypothetical protein [Anaerolineales bacterium]
MRAIFLTTLAVLLAACGSSAVTGRELAPPSPAMDRLAASTSARSEAELPQPYQEVGGVEPAISSASSSAESS